MKAEKGIKDALVSDAISRYMAYLTSYSKFPRIMFTLMGLLLTYYFFSSLHLSPGIIEGVFAVIALAPGLIWIMRLYYTGYLLDTTRKSAKDKLFETFTGVPVRAAIIPVLFFNVTDYKLWQNNNYYFITLFFVSGVIYNMALYQLYRDEFKTAAQ